MKEQIREALRRATGDYVEVRTEETEVLRIGYRGEELEELDRSVSAGGNIRVFHKGGWGVVSFTRADGIGELIEEASSHARSVQKTAFELPSVPVVSDEVIVPVTKDPGDVALEEKITLMEQYNAILLAPLKVQTSRLRYRETWTKKHFYSSEGSDILQDMKSVALGASAIAKDGTLVETAGKGFGGTDGFQVVEGLEQELEEVAKLAVELLSAEPVKGGRYQVIIDPLLAGVFAHEAFGHTSEADFTYKDEKMQKIMQIGRTFGSEGLSIVDDGTLVGKLGYSEYDDEGVSCSKTYLIKEGVLVGRLHSRETAALMEEAATGNARALNYRFPPIVRMTNTYIERGDWRFEDLLEGIEEGLYVKGSRGGEGGEMFSFAAQEAYEIKKGKVGRLLRDLTLSGNLFKTLKSIDRIGDDLKLFGGVGGCGKSGQGPLPVSLGGPHVRIRDITVGGR